jgi:hypothetical protein
MTDIQTVLNDANAQLATLQTLWNSGLAGLTGGMTGVSPCPHCTCQEQMNYLSGRISTLQASLNAQQAYQAQQSSLATWLQSNDSTLISQVMGTKMNTMTADQLTTLNNSLQVLSQTMTIPQLQALYGN